MEIDTGFTFSGVGCHIWVPVTFEEAPRVTCEGAHTQASLLWCWGAWKWRCGTKRYAHAHCCQRRWAKSSWKRLATAHTPWLESGSQCLHEPPGEYAWSIESTVPARARYAQGVQSQNPCRFNGNTHVLQGMPVSYAMRKKVEEELEWLTEEGIVEPIHAVFRVGSTSGPGLEEWLRVSSPLWRV